MQAIATGRLKDRNKMERRLGKIQARHPQVSDLYDLNLRETAEELWSKYMQLTEAEASFRALKSELSVRPLYHQLEPRVKAHIMVAFLGYALWVILNICSSAGRRLCHSHR